MKHFLPPVSRVLLVVAPLGFLALFTALALGFDYPAILRQAPGDVLTRFHQGGAGLVALWYGLAVASLMLVPASVAAARALPRTTALRFFVVLGVAAGLVQAVGFLRWSFVVPELARLWVDPASSEAVRASVLVAFDVLGRFVGQGVGEHLGYLATAGWTVALVVLLDRQRPRERGLAALGLVLAAGVAYGLAEPLGAPAAGLVNALAYTLWALWLPVVALFARLEVSPPTP